VSPRAVWAGVILAILLASGAAAQTTGPDGGAGGGSSGGIPGSGGSGGGRRGVLGGPSRAPLPDQSSSPRTSDPEAYDAIDLFSRLCVSTRGDRTRAIAIVGDNNDGAIEKMDPPLLRGMENGQSGGVGWIIRMPLGDKLLLEFPPDGSCVVRAPRVDAGQLERSFHNLLDQYAGSGQFDIRREGEETRLVDPPAKKPGDATQPAAGAPKQEWRVDSDKLKYHILAYSMKLPDLDRPAHLVLATTESEAVAIQGVLSYAILPETPRKNRP
jgi:hypothetical protein